MNDTHIAFFAPLANTQWDNFDAATNMLNVSNTTVPVRSPQLTDTLSVCVANSTIARRETLDIVWEQDGYVTGQDNWYLRIQSVQIGSVTQEITSTNDSGARYK